MAAAQRERSAAAVVVGETSGSLPGLVGPLYGPVGRFCVVQSFAETLPLAVQYSGIACCDRLQAARACEVRGAGGRRRGCGGTQQPARGRAHSARMR